MLLSHIGVPVHHPLSSALHPASGAGALAPYALPSPGDYTLPLTPDQGVPGGQWFAPFAPQPPTTTTHSHPSAFGATATFLPSGGPVGTPGPLTDWSPGYWSEGMEERIVKSEEGLPDPREMSPGAPRSGTHSLSPASRSGPGSVSGGTPSGKKGARETFMYSKCSVCDDIAEGYHFSSLSCSACSAFFRRSVADQKTYACVTRNCNVSINLRRHGVICRYCRFQKCIQAGMTPEEVQGKRSKHAAEPANNAVSAAPNGWTPQRKCVKSRSAFRGMNLRLLNEISTARRNLGVNRKRLMNFSPTGFLSQLNLDREFEFFRQFVSALPAFSPLLPELAAWRENRELQNLFLSWLIFEAVFATIRFGGIQTNRVYMNETAFVDIDIGALTAYFNDGSNRDPTGIANLAYPALQHFAGHLCRVVQNFRLDERETAALLGLLLVHNANSHSSSALKEQIFKELGDHYAQNDGDSSLKMANVVLIISTFDEVLAKAREFQACYQLLAF